MNLKRWTIAGAAILVIAGIAPWGVGYLTQQHWQEATREVNSAQPFLRMETGKYNRGLLGAEVSGTITLLDPATGQSNRIDFEVQVSHGVTGSFLDFRPTEGWQPPGAEWFPEAEPKLTLETRVWGSATLELLAPVIHIDHPVNGGSLRSSGGLARLEIGRLGEQADMLLVWPAMVLAGPAMNVSIEDIHLEQSLAWLSGDIWTGSGTMTVESVVVQEHQAPPLTLNGFSLNSHSEAGSDGERLDSTLSLALESVSFDDEAFGPHRMDVAVDGLDVASWNAFSSVMTDMQMMAQQASGQAPPAAFEQQMALMQRFNESVHGLAAAGFSAGIRELSLDTPEGPVQGSLDISHPELSDRERDNMLMVMQQLTGALDLSMPLALAENYPGLRMQLAPLIKQGLLVENGDQLVMAGRMQNLVLDINGISIPLPPLL
ncbi:DUF945 family protein [Marinobacter halophilus]|uniref:DUF945 domain-containing protein n=1 Tax=Marinobacter halophilus TaxID=1323740 RepID=A0A2T1KF97_9GAMM|nr:DUF945 family protein [Marinobacter halophilus]PSF08799.1 DUF945 domain-containing protein [Marinobacter halophilus]GGC63943.1 hypothetical protein GCM10011362_10370 [Marinobacter halophilus]